MNAEGSDDDTYTRAFSLLRSSVSSVLSSLRSIPTSSLIFVIIIVEYSTIFNPSSTSSVIAVVAPHLYRYVTRNVYQPIAHCNTRLPMFPFQTFALSSLFSLLKSSLNIKIRLLPTQCTICSIYLLLPPNRRQRYIKYCHCIIRRYCFLFLVLSWLLLHYLTLFFFIKINAYFLYFIFL